MKDFVKDIEKIRNLVLVEYDKKLYNVFKDIKIRKRIKTQLNTGMSWYMMNRYKDYDKKYINNQMDHKVVNQFESVKKSVLEYARVEFERYNRRYFHGYLSFKNIKIDMDYGYSVGHIDGEKFFFFIVGGKEMSEYDFAYYLKEKYYYIKTLDKISNINEKVS